MNKAWIFDNQVYINFYSINSSEIFEELREILHANAYTYDKDQKVNFTSPHNFLMTYHVFGDCGETFSEEFVSEVEKISLPISSIKLHRRQLKPECFVKPPFVSKTKYQEQAIEKLIRHDSFILAYDTGLGKTMISISAINHVWEEEKLDHLLILTVGSVTYNWKKELLKFSNLFKEDEILISTSQVNREAFSDPKYKVVIMKYDVFKVISQDWDMKIRKQKMSSPLKNYIDFSQWGTNIACILDEFHSLANPSSLRTKYVLHARHNFKIKWLLSATPWPNFFRNSYAPIKFIDENLVYGMDYQDWLKETHEIGTKYSRYAPGKEKTGIIDYYKSIFAPYILTGDKRVLYPEGFQKLNIKSIYCPLTEEQTKIYLAVAQFIINRIKVEKKNVSTYEIASKFPYLLQIVSDPILLKGKIVEASINKMLDNWQMEMNAKTYYCDELLEEHIGEKGEKVIIWCTNPEVVEALAKHYAEYKPFFAHGQSTPKGITKEAYRNNLMNEFKESKDRKLLIANDELFGTGENIEVANVVIFWNLIFSYRRYYQALNRIDRPGQEKEMYVYKLFTDKTIDLIAEQIIEKKLELNDLKNNWEILDLDETVKLLKGEV